jgi:hypothetical protein
LSLRVTPRVSISFLIDRNRDFGPPIASLTRCPNIAILYSRFLARQRCRAILTLECAQDIEKLLEDEKI